MHVLLVYMENELQGTKLKLCIHASLPRSVCSRIDELWGCLKRAKGSLTSSHSPVPSPTDACAADLSWQSLPVCIMVAKLACIYGPLTSSSLFRS